MATRMYDLGGEVDLINWVGVVLALPFEFDLREELQYSLGRSIVGIKLGLRDELG